MNEEVAQAPNFATSLVGRVDCAYFEFFEMSRVLPEIVEIFVQNLKYFADF